MILQLFVVFLASSLVKSSVVNINMFTDENTKEDSLTTCEAKACDVVCKTYGFKDGQCADGWCKCFYFERAKHYTNALHSPGDCDVLTCETYCESIGSTGFCAGGICYCYYFKSLKELKSKVSSSLVVESCDSQECDQMCRIIFGSPGGSCVGGQCECKTFKPIQVLKSKVSSSLVDESCDSQECDQMCRIIFGSPGGSCVGGQCECKTFKPIQEFLHLISPKKSIKHENSVNLLKIIKDNDKPEKALLYDEKTCKEYCNNANYIINIFIGNRCSCF